MQLCTSHRLMSHRIDLDELIDLNLEGIKGILIDIDDTLYSYQDSHKKALSLCVIKFHKEFPSLEKTIGSETFKDLYRGARNQVTSRLQFNGSCRSRLLAFQEIFENINKISLHDAYECAIYFEEYYWASLIDNMFRNEEMYLFIEKCQTNHLKVCAVSDMQTSFQMRKLSKLGYKNISLVTSEEVGIEKPSAIIFNRALNKINLKPHQVIMIGDSYSKDIEGASNLGIKSFQVSLND